MAHAHFSTSERDSLIGFPISFVATRASSFLFFLNSSARVCTNADLFLMSFFHSLKAALDFFIDSLIFSLLMISYSAIISSVAGLIVFTVITKPILIIVLECYSDFQSSKSNGNQVDTLNIFQ